jgi:hypothetical protein
MARVALSVVAMGIAMGGSMVARWTAYARAVPAFEVSPVIAGGCGGCAGRGVGKSMARISRTPQRIAFQATLGGDIITFAYGLPLDRIERRPQ